MSTINQVSVNDAIELLIKEGILEVTREKIIEYIENNDIEKVKVLIKHIPADFDCFIEAVNAPVDADDTFEMLKVLFTNHNLTYEYKLRVLEQVIKVFDSFKDASPVIEFLLDEIIKDRPVKPTYVNHVLETCKHGSLSDLKKVVQSEDIDQSDLHETLDYCWKEKDYEAYVIIDEVCNNRFKEIPSFINLCSNNNNDALKLVKFVSPSIKKEGLRICYNTGYTDLFNKLALA